MEGGTSLVESPPGSNRIALESDDYPIAAQAVQAAPYQAPGAAPLLVAQVVPAQPQTARVVVAQPQVAQVLYAGQLPTLSASADDNDKASTAWALVGTGWFFCCCSWLIPMVFAVRAVSNGYHYYKIPQTVTVISSVIRYASVLLCIPAVCQYFRVPAEQRHSYPKLKSASTCGGASCCAMIGCLVCSLISVAVAGSIVVPRVNPGGQGTCPAPLSTQMLTSGPHTATAVTVHARALGWNKLQRASPKVVHELIFAVKQKNLDKVERMLHERSDPKSPLYGDWLSGKEVRELTMNIEAVEAVIETLKRAGAEVKTKTPGGELVRARASVEVWEKLLQTQFHVYESKDKSAQTHIAADMYALPAPLLPHTEAVLGCLEIPAKNSNGPKKTLKSKTGGRAGLLDPNMIRKAYNMPDVAAPDSPEAKSRANVSQCAYASLKQFRSPSDTKAFQQKYGLPIRPVKELDTDTKSHSNDRQCILHANSCTEAMLDVEYMIAMSPWSQMGFWYMDLVDGSFIEFLAAVLERPSPPEVISMSYGGFEQQHHPSQIKVFNDNAMKLGLQGVTLMAATGDDGAQGGLWRNHDENCAATKQAGLQVNWPASSPYITAVGATMGTESGLPEVACQVQCQAGVSTITLCQLDNGPVITSGGGYSQYPQPDWQKDAKLECNTRGIPDVALAGHSFNIIVGGEEAGVDGTSASSPTFAGMVTLVNARRKTAGQPTVGFINPAMYANPSAFNDITSGDNKCGGMSSAEPGTQQVNCCGGWSAKTGWDAVTGLGSPDFKKFENIFPSKKRQVEQVVV